MQNNSNKKYGMSVVLSLLLSLAFTLVVGAFIFTNQNASLFILSTEWGWLFITSLLLLFFAASYWRFSGGYWRLRDQMVNSMPGNSYSQKAIRMFLISVGAGIAVGVVLIAYQATNT